MSLRGQLAQAAAQEDKKGGCGLLRHIQLDDSYTYELTYSDRTTGEVVYHAVRPDVGGGCDVYVDETDGVPTCNDWRLQPCPDSEDDGALIPAEYRCQDSEHETFDVLSGCGMTLRQTYVDNDEILLEYAHASSSELIYRAYLSQVDTCVVELESANGGPPHCEDWTTEPCPLGSTRVTNVGDGGAPATPD